MLCVFIALSLSKIHLFVRFSIAFDFSQHFINDNMNIINDHVSKT